jgi:probable F420-dependent oxidoreductase
MTIPIGLIFFPAADAANPVELIARADELGFDSIFLPDHTHVAVGTKSPFAGGGDMPRYYAELHDPFITLAAAACVTSHIKLATGICLVPQRDPILLAKETATIDVLSGGRFEFGVGAGWNVEEMRNHGISDPETRWRRLKEGVEAIKRIWTEDEPEYHGEFVDFDPIRLRPKPVQKPHPPIILGGGGLRVTERVLDYGDEWLPSRPLQQRPLHEQVADLREQAERAGRGVRVTMYGADADADTIRQLEADGFDRVLVSIPPVERSAAFEVLERHARLLPG